MKNSYIHIFFALFCIQYCIGQNTGINTSTPAPSSALDIFANDKGLIFPRVSLDSVTGIITPILNPAESLLIWNTNPDALNSLGVGPYYFKNGKWEYGIEKNGLDACYDKGGNGVGYYIHADALPVQFDENAGANDAFIVTGKLSKGFNITSVNGLPNITDGTISFFTPAKAAFRAGRVTGNQWDQANNGRHSFSSGFNNTSIGNRTFTTNFNNIASKISSSSFGSNNTTSGEISVNFGDSNTTNAKNTINSGSNNFSNAYVNLITGSNNRGRVVNEVIFGTFSKNYPVTDSSGGFEPGDDPLGTVGIDSKWTRYETDRTFAVGYGNGVGLEKNAIEIIKNGTTIINESYKLSLVDGSNDQIIKTDGSGNLSWENRITEKNVTNISLTAGDYNYPIPVGNTNSSLYPVPFCATSFKLSDFDLDNDGEVEIKVLVTYSNRIQSTTQFQRSELAVDELSNTSGTFLVTNGNFTYSGDVAAPAAPATSGVAHSIWKKVNTSGTANVASHDIFQLYCRNRNNSTGGTTADDSQMTIEDVSFLVRDR